MEFFKSNTFFKLSLYGFALTSPFSVAFGQIFLSFIVLAWLLRIVLNKSFIYKRTPIDVFILIYLFSQIAASLFSKSGTESFNNFLNNEWIVVMYFAIVSNLDEDSFKKVFILLISSSVVVGLYSIFQHYYGYDFYRGRFLKDYSGTGFFRAEGFFGLCLTYGGYTMAVTMTAMGGFFGRLNTGLKTFFGISALILFYSVIVSYTRSNWIAVHLSGFLLALLKGFKKLLFFAGFIILFWILIYFFHYSLISFKSFKSMVDTSERMPDSNKARLELWSKSLQIIKDNPVFGLGIGQFKSVHDKYDFSEGARYGHPHNDLLNIGVNSGLFGLISFVLIWVIFFYKVLKKYFFSLNKENLIISLMLGGALAILGFLISGLFQCYYTDLEDGMLWWFITALTMWISINGTSRSGKLL